MARDSMGITLFYLPPTHDPYLTTILCMAAKALQMSINVYIYPVTNLASHEISGLRGHKSGSHSQVMRILILKC